MAGFPFSDIKPATSTTDKSDINNRNLAMKSLNVNQIKEVNGAVSILSPMGCWIPGPNSDNPNQPNTYPGTISNNDFPDINTFKG